MELAQGFLVGSLGGGGLDILGADHDLAETAFLPVGKKMVDNILLEAGRHELLGGCLIGQGECVRYVEQVEFLLLLVGGDSFIVCCCYTAFLYGSGGRVDVIGGRLVLCSLSIFAMWGLILVGSMLFTVSLHDLADKSITIQAVIVQVFGGAGIEFIQVGVIDVRDRIHAEQFRQACFGTLFLFYGLVQTVCYGFNGLSCYFSRLVMDRFLFGLKLHVFLQQLASLLFSIVFAADHRSGTVPNGPTDGQQDSMMADPRPVLQEHFVNFHEKFADVDEGVHVHVVGERSVYDIPDAAEEAMEEWDFGLQLLLAFGGKFGVLIAALDDI